jgi:hypothetical protein
MLQHTESPPRGIICRWRGHYKDVVAVITQSRIQWIARDVLDAVEVDQDTFRNQPDQTRPLPERAARCSLWSRDAINVLLEDYHADPLVQEFLAWIDDEERRMERAGLAALERGNNPRVEPRRVIAPADVEPVQPSRPTARIPESFSVSDSAVILSRDPAIKLRPTDLRTKLLDYGWMRKPAGEYIPNDDQVQLGYLAVVLRKVRARETPYPQVQLTPDGLQEIHKRLGGVSAIDLTLTDQEPA